MLDVTRDQNIPVDFAGLQLRPHRHSSQQRKPQTNTRSAARLTRWHVGHEMLTEKSEAFADAEAGSVQSNAQFCHVHVTSLVKIKARRHKVNQSAGASTSVLRGTQTLSVATVVSHFDL